MTIKKAIERLSFTISKANKPNNNDAQALNAVIEWVNEQQQETLREQQLFAKLYTFLFSGYLKQFGGYEAAMRLIDIELQTPLENHLEDLVRVIHMNEFDDLCKELGVKDTLHLLDSEKLEEVRKSNAKLFSKHSQDFIAILSGKYDKEAISNRLEQLILDKHSQFSNHA